MPLTRRVGQALFDRTVAPAVVLQRTRFVVFLHRFGERDQALGRVGTAVEQHVLDEFEQVSGNLFVDREHAGIDDAHVHAGLDGMIQKRRVHRFAHRHCCRGMRMKCC